MNLIKKAFLISMVAVIGLMGVAFTPVAAENVASAGDLIKTEGYTAVYYLDADGFKHPFPSEREFMSWYEDFGDVVTVAQDEMTSYTLGASVTVRPGAKLLQYVEISSDGSQFLTANTPEVYGVAVDGLLHKLDSAEAAVALYGANWESMIFAVPTYLAGGYSATGAALTAASTYPSGTLVQMDDQVYYIDGDSKRPVTDAGMTGNRFNADYVIAVTDLSAYSDGTSVTATEDALANPATGATDPGTVVGGSGLTVALASDNPGAQVGPLSATGVTLMKINVTASSDGAVDLDGLTFTRRGVGATGDFSNLYIYDGATRLTSGKSINSSTHKATFINLDFNVPAGTTKVVSLVADLNSATAGNFSYFEVGSDDVSSDAAINGSFPLVSNTLTLGSSVAGTITIAKNGTLANPTVAQQNAQIAQFKLTAGSAENLEISRITLYQAGSINSTYITDLELYQGADLLGTVSGITSNSLVVFDLSDSPFILEKNTNRIFKIYGDISGDSRNGDTTKIYLENTSDLLAVGSFYGYGAGVTSGDYDGVSGDADTTTLTVQGGQITVAKNGPQSSTVARGGTEVELLNFSITSGVNAELRKLRLELHNDSTDLDTDDDDTACDTSSNYISNVKIVDVDNGDSTSGVDCGTFTEISGSDAGIYYDYTDYFNFDAGQTRTFKVVADLNVSLSTTGNYYATLGSTGSTYTINTTDGIKNTDNNQWITDIVPTTHTTGNDMTVAAASLGIALASNAAGVTVVQGTEDVNLGEFAFNAGSGSDMTITGLTLYGYVGTDTTNVVVRRQDCGAAVYTTVNNLISSLALYDITADPDMTNNLNSTIESFASATGAATFSNVNWTIPGGETHVMRVVGDTVNTAYTNGCSVNKTVKINVATAAGVSINDDTGTDVTLTDNDGTAWAIADGNGSATLVASSYYVLISDAGTLNVTTESNPSIANVVAGTSDVPMLNLKFQAVNEAFNLNKVRIQQLQADGNRAVDSVTIGYMNEAGETITANNVEISGNADFNITTNPFYIPANTYRIMNVYFNIPAINQTNATYSGDEIYANFDSDANFEAKSADSGSTSLTAPSDTTDRAGSVMTVMGTVPTFTADNTTNASLINGPAELYRFQVSAPEGGTALSLKKLSFKLSLTDSVQTTSTLSLTNFQVYEGSSYSAATVLTQSDTATDGYQVYNGYGVTTTTANGTGTGGKLSSSTGVVYQNYAGNTSSTSHDVIVVFNDDRLISAGSSKYFILKATAGNVNTGASSSDSISMYLNDGDSSTTAYNYITAHCDATGVSGVPGKFCLTDDASGTTDAAAYMIWSDNTGTNGNNTHADITADDSSSADWYNGYKIKTLDVTRVLN